MADELPADAIALLLTDASDRILVFWHRKHRFWTVPIGKIEMGELAPDAARREAHEELGLHNVVIEPLGVARRPTSTGHTEIVFAMFQIVQFAGELRNREPEKHASMQFVTSDALASLDPLSFATQMLRDQLKVPGAAPSL